MNNAAKIEELNRAIFDIRRILDYMPQDDAETAEAYKNLVKAFSGLISFRTDLRQDED